MNIVGIDIGGSYIKIVDSEGRRRKEENPGDFNVLMELISRIVSGYDASGIAVAGFVDLSGFIHKSPNIPFFDGKKIEIKEKKFFVANDATLACLGEVVFGSGRAWRKRGIVVCITLGTGLGGGFVVDGEPFLGESGIAMEVGHVPISEDERRICRCGRVGCAEEFVSARALVRYYIEITGIRDNITPERVISLASSGDKNAIGAVERLAYYTARVVQLLSHIFNPSAFIISGGIFEYFPKVIDMIREHAAGIVIPYIFNAMKILPAELGEFSGAYGALAYCKMKIEKSK